MIARQGCILILELSAGGHHPTYMRWLLQSKIARSAKIILASRKAMFEHFAIRACSEAFTPHEIQITPQLERRLNRFGGADAVYKSWEVGSLYRKTFAFVSQMTPIDFVVVPFLDDCLLGLAAPNEAFGGTPWITITMRTRFHFDHMGVIAPRQRFASVRRLLFERLLRQKSLKAVLTIDPTLVEFARRQRDPGFRKVEYLPDPATNHGILPSKSDTRRQLNIPTNASVVLLYGEIAARKGVMTLLESAADAACHSQLHVLLAGRCVEPEQLVENKGYQKLLAQGRLHRIDGYLDDEQELAILAASDCMWVGYTDFYLMSGVMVLSGRHGLPVVASSNGLVGYLTRKHNVGIAIEVTSRSSVVAVLNKLVQNPEAFVCAGRNGPSAFLEHDPVEFQRIVTAKAGQVWN